MTFEAVAAAVAGLLAGMAIVYAAMRAQRNSRFEAYRASQEAGVEERIREESRAAVDKSRNVLKGKIGEHMAPLLSEFCEKYRPSEARFMGAPVDYVIFRNMDGEDPIEVALVDVKSGKAGLSSVQRRIRDAVREKRVSFDTIRIDGAPPGEAAGATVR